MEPLDGNAIGGALLDYFGQEMTAAWGSCAHCGASARVAQLAVYLTAAGAVVRCRVCGQVVIVVVTVRDTTRVYHRDFLLRDAPHSRPQHPGR